MQDDRGYRQRELHQQIELTRLIVQIALASGTNPLTDLEGLQALLNGQAITDQMRDELEHLAAIADYAALLDGLTQVHLDEADAARTALDGGVPNWRIIRASTPDDADMAAFRAGQDERVANLDAELAEHLRHGRDDRRTHEEDTDRARDGAWNATMDDWHAALAAARTPISQARGSTDDRLAVLRRYLYAQLQLPWIAYAAPCHIATFDAETKLCTVTLDDGSGQRIDGVDYGSGMPSVGQATTLYVPAQVPESAADPRVRPRPAGRCWVTLPPSRKMLYYPYGLNLWRLPWPLADPDAEPELVRNLFADNPVTQDWWVHPEQHLGFDGRGTWWVELNYVDSSHPVWVYYFWLIGYDALAQGEVHAHFYGSQDRLGTTVQLHPRVWAVDPTPGYSGFMGFWYSSGPGAGVSHGVPGTYGSIAFADEAGGEWTYGTPFLLTDRYGGQGALDSGGDEYRRQLFDHNAYWLWRDEQGTRRARWGLEPRRGLGESSTHFYDANSASAELANAGYFAHAWAGPGGPAEQTLQFFWTQAGTGITRRAPDGAVQPLALPPSTRYVVGQDRTLTDLLVTDQSWHYWASEDGGDTWYQTPYQLPSYAGMVYEGGKWAYIIDETEYGGAA